MFADIKVAMNLANLDLQQSIEIARLERTGVIPDDLRLLYRKWLNTSEGYREAVRSLAGIKGP